MAAPRKGNTSCLLICLTALAVSEFGVITQLILPLPSTRIDWLAGTLFIAPMAAFVPLWLAMLTIRLTWDICALLAFLLHRMRNIRA